MARDLEIVCNGQVVGTIPRERALEIRRKRNAKTYQIAGASPHVARLVVGMLAVPPTARLESVSDALGAYRASRELGSEDLVRACVDFVWNRYEAREEEEGTIIDEHAALWAFAGVLSPRPER